MRLPEQVARLGIVIASLFVIVLMVRFVIVPSTYFATDLHRSMTVMREVSKPVSFAGALACRECHYEQVETKRTGYHKTLGCETCHGPSAEHTSDPFSAKPYAPRDRKFCPICHEYDAGRPTGFPQINVTAHNPLKPCITCHEPHDPEPTEVPRECSACHAQIARTKAVSSHALIDCTTCHETDTQHKVSPRTVRPTTPQTRAFCGDCHSQDSEDPDPPKVDLDEHGNDYLCWQCHYPHLPEGNGG